MNCICPMNFFRTIDTTDTTIWKPGLIDTSQGTPTQIFTLKEVRRLGRKRLHGPIYCQYQQ